MKSLLLDRTAWDLVIGADGNIAAATDPYAFAQDVACAVKLFQGELFYDTTKGIPYWQDILGQWPPLSVVQAAIVRAALTVPGVIAARCDAVTFAGRALSGQVIVTDSAGVEQIVNF